LIVIFELALAAMLTTRATAPEPPSPVTTKPVAVVFGGADLARAIKTDIESISGPGSVEVSIDHETLFSVRVAVPGLRPGIYTQIYDRELDFYRRYPDLNFDFYLHAKPAPPNR
jgi:hypothetical protein